MKSFLEWQLFNGRSMKCLLSILDRLFAVTEKNSAASMNVVQPSLTRPKDIGSPAESDVIFFLLYEEYVSLYDPDAVSTLSSYSAADYSALASDASSSMLAALPSAAKTVIAPYTQLKSLFVRAYIPLLSKQNYADAGVISEQETILDATFTAAEKSLIKEVVSPSSPILGYSSFFCRTPNAEAPVMENTTWLSTFSAYLNGIAITDSDTSAILAERKSLLLSVFRKISEGTAR